MMSNKQFYEYYTDFDTIIDGMRVKLLDAMKRNPKGDYSQPNYTMEKLQRLQIVFHSMYHDQQTIDNDSGKIMMERDKFIKRISKLETEISTIKSNLNL